jgi:predicted RNA binding protein YcfA (HicA-like mRNA interferase family)
MTRTGKVTVPIHGKNEININTLKSIFKQAGIKKII